MFQGVKPGKKYLTRLVQEGDKVLEQNESATAK